ncbi:MAG: hypothetical protein K6E54_11270 [Bacteroidaceae bacterium]|nr:hypothetical protein [Bacteroidaceae bacterium]
MLNKLKWLLIICCIMTTTNIKAQTTKKSAKELAIIADKDTTDYAKQWAAAEAYMGKNDSIEKNQNLAAKYLERIVKIGTRNNDVPDSIITIAAFCASTIAVDNQDFLRSKLYMDEYIRFQRQNKGLLNNNNIPGFMALTAFWSWFTGSPSSAVARIEEARQINETLPDKYKVKGFENTDVLLLLGYEMTLEKYQKWIEERLIEVTIEGQPYLIVATNTWNVERPMVGWLNSDSQVKQHFVFYSVNEDRLYDNLSGDMSFNFNCSEGDNTITKSETTNTQVVTVDSVYRQHLIELYREYCHK